MMAVRLLNAFYYLNFIIYLNLSKVFDFSIVTTWFDSLLRDTLGLGNFLSILIECVLVGLIILMAYAMLAIVLIYMERKVCAFFQCRLGPMRVGKWGIFQVFADVVKMLIKEIFPVDKADKLLYAIAPFLVLIGSVGAFSFMPWNKELPFLAKPLFQWTEATMTIRCF